MLHWWCRGKKEGGEVNEYRYLLVFGGRLKGNDRTRESIKDKCQQYFGRVNRESDNFLIFLEGSGSPVKQRGCETESFGTHHTCDAQPISMTISFKSVMQVVVCRLYKNRNKTRGSSSSHRCDLLLSFHPQIHTKYAELEPVRHSRIRQNSTEPYWKHYIR